MVSFKHKDAVSFSISVLEIEMRLDIKSII